MSDSDMREQVKEALQAFSGTDLRTTSIDLLNTLGYQSEKTLDLDGSPDAFLKQFDTDPDRKFSKEKAFFDEWQDIHLLFQLTDEELSGNKSLFEQTEVKQSQKSS